MARQSYRIEGFSGLNQAVCENRVPNHESPAAVNVETEGGNLSVAKGYVRQTAARLPDSVTPLRLLPYRRGNGTGFLVAADQGVYRLNDEETAYEPLIPYETPLTGTAGFDALELMINSTRRLLITNGRAGIYQWDYSLNAATRFGTAEGLSDKPCTMIALYMARLFAAGEAAHPARLYWSSAPGEGRTVEDWSSQPESENVGGGFVEVGTDGEPITALAALSNQLVIFKRDAVYRLLGDRPANFRVISVNAAMDACYQQALVRYGDGLFFLTKTGLHHYDGQTARRLPDANRIQHFLETVSLTNCTATVDCHRIYFALRDTADANTAETNTLTACNNAVLIYDLLTGTYLLRRGFTVTDLKSADGVLYLLDGEGYLNRFNEGETYAGREIVAQWRTPETDLGDKASVKQLRELYLRGSGGLILVTAVTGAGQMAVEKLMPANGRDILEIPLTGEGRSFYLMLENVNGSRFTVEGGMELTVDVRRRVL